jgi:hypothetical protein
MMTHKNAIACCDVSVEQKEEGERDKKTTRENSIITGTAATQTTNSF